MLSGSGFDLAVNSAQGQFAEDMEQGVPYLFIIPGFAALIILTGLLAKRSPRVLQVLCALIPIIAAGYGLYEYLPVLGSNMASLLGVGIYVSLIGAFGLLLSGLGVIGRK